MSSKQVFFIGIKGVGMTSLAVAMQDAGWIVSGSDTGESFITDDILAARGIPVSTPVLSPVPPETNLIIYSGAYTPSPSAIKTLPLAQALAEFAKDRKVIAVAGVGGKTTTSAMMASLFHALNLPVGYYVGTGSISGLAAPGAAGTNPWYVVESDEYAIGKTDHRPKFALLKPEIVVTTNIIHDHPDIYPDESATMKVFADLVASIPPGGTWICNPSDPLTAQILRLQGPTLKAIKVVQYGSDHPLYSQLKLSVFGDQNRLDALAAVLAAIASGTPESDALEAITSYHGAGRRQEFHGEVAGRLLYDDYGHHPREIELTVQSFKEYFPTRRLILVFESHTYTRTESLLDDFAKAIAIADLAFIMPIFESAREKGQPHSITPDSFAAMIPGAQALTWDSAATKVWDSSSPGDVILTMGAGFVYKLHDQFKLH
jgi:UDP-N-acetylmuramate--alanine ligase